MSIISPEVVENNRNLITGILSVVVNHLVAECYVTVIVSSSSVLPSEMVVISYWSLRPKGLFTYVAMCSLVVLFLLLSCNHHWLDNFKNVVDLLMLLKQTIQKFLDNIWPLVDYWFLSVVINRTDNHIAES